MTGANFPEMSVVLVTPDSYETIRTTMKHLRAQTVRDRLEIVIVAPSKGGLHLDHGEIKEFLHCRVVEVDEVQSIAEGNAAGVRQASAPVVALAEDHSYPDPGWAAALIEAHRHAWAAVGPAVRNANPKSVTSWADFLIAYGPWSEPVTAGEVEHLPGHNSSYKREILLDYGPGLEAMLGAESILHWDLRARGYRLFLEPKAKIAHLNFGLLSSLIQAQFHSGRLFAAVRARQWCTLRRLLYSGGAPLIPLVRLRRILRQLPGSSRQRNSPLRILAVLVLGLTVSAIGEGVGYALGSGDAGQKLSHFEFHRVRHLAKRDRARAGGQ